ncbi:hypothetical protein OKW21_002361 [Catalinimonas alkaloidigena]|nr:hypothetical protein [Catalinimonas alkaloidigena]
MVLCYIKNMDAIIVKAILSLRFYILVFYLLIKKGAGLLENDFV